MTTELETKKRFVTVEMLSKELEWASPASIRKMLFNRRANGLGEHVRKVGKRLLIDHVGFMLWLDSHKEQS